MVGVALVAQRQVRGWGRLAATRGSRQRIRGAANDQSEQGHKRVSVPIVKEVWFNFR